MNSKVISFLRFPLTFLVVVIHSRGTIVTVNDWTHLTQMDFYAIVKLLLSEGIAQTAVPMFFFISGYLFFMNVDRLDFTLYKQKLSKRVQSLLVPFILWNLLCIPLSMMVRYGETLSGTSMGGAALDYWQQIDWLHLFWDHFSKDGEYANLLGMRSLSACPILVSFWYVRDLMVVSLFTPIIYWFCKHTGRIGVLLVVVLMLLRIWPNMVVRFWCLFFVLGSYWGLRKKDLYIQQSILRWGNYLLSVVLLVIVVILQSNNSREGWLVMPLCNLSCIGSIFCLSTAFLKAHPDFKFPSILTQSSFFVYALHIEFSISFGFFMAKTLTAHTQQPLLLTVQYLLTPVITYAFSLFCYWVLRQVWPKATELLCGRR